MQFRKIIPKILIIVVLTAFLGELKITPFGSSFRFGLGSAGFFFLLLLYKNVPYRLTGLITGVFTTFFRVGLDYFFVDSFSIFQSIQNHSPIIGYYFTFAILLHFIKKNSSNIAPIWMGLWGAFCDSSSNFVELFIINLYLPNDVFNSVDIKYVLVVGFIRSFFVVGLYNIFQVNKLNAVYEEQRTRFEEVQTILSELYIEVFYLKKTLSEIEDVTAKGYKLYRGLKEAPTPNQFSTLALAVVQEVHEVKKDNQRILAGLEKLIRHENTKLSMSLSEMINLCIKSNDKYAKFLRKNIHFSTNQQIDVKVSNVYPFLVIINNLVANGIEAIKKTGFVEINSRIEQSHIIIDVIDSGVGISIAEQEVIFEPGYTSKFDENGKASTGIGLSHVKAMVEELGGTIKVLSNRGFTSFTVHLPKSVLNSKG